MGWELICDVLCVCVFSLLIFLNKNKSQFTPNSEIHNYATRQQINFHLHQVNLTKCQKGIGYLGIKVFNKLPQYLTEESDDPKKFKVSLKNYLGVLKHFIHCTSILNCNDIQANKTKCICV